MVGIDSRSEPLGLAKGLKLAPDLLLSFDEGHDSATKKISELDPSKDYPGVDAVVIATDNLPSFEYGTKILRKHGTLVIVGQPKDPIPIRYFDAIFRYACPPSIHVQWQISRFTHFSLSFTLQQGHQLQRISSGEPRDNARVG